MKQRPPNMTEKWAATLLQLLDAQGNGIPFDEAKLMTPDQVIALFQCDHEHSRAAGGGNHPTNLTMRLYREHRDKTAKVDVPRIKKGVRLAKKEAAHQQAVRAKILAVPEEAPEDRRARYQRSLRNMHGPRFSEFQRPLQSRSNFEKRKP